MKSKKRYAMTCLGLLGLLFVLVIGGIGCSDSCGECGPEDKGDPSSAWYMAKQFVDEELSVVNTSYHGGKNVINLGNDNFEVSGWIDAENASGAKIQNSFLCQLQYMGDSNWRCTSIIIF